MRVLSTLIGNHPVRSTPVDTIAVGFTGVSGDRHQGKSFAAKSYHKLYHKHDQLFNTRQLTIVSQPELDEIAETLGIAEITPSQLGANLLVSEPITDCEHLSTLWAENGVVMICMGLNTPCTTVGKEIAGDYPDHNKLSARFVKAAMGKRGINAICQREGSLSVGEELVIRPFAPF